MGVLHYFESGQFQASETDGSLLQFDWLVCLSGLPPLRYHELPRSLRRDPGEFRVRSEAAGRSAGILVNAFLELEEKVTQIWTGPAQPGFEHFKVFSLLLPFRSETLQEAMKVMVTVSPLKSLPSEEAYHQKCGPLVMASQLQLRQQPATSSCF